MSNAKRDGNFVPTIQGVSSVDGLTPTDIHVDPVTNETLVKINDPIPTAGNNPSYLISYNAAGEAVYIDTIISGTTYRQTFTRSDMTITSTLLISENVEL